MMKPKHFIAVAALTPMYWIIAITVIANIAYELAERCGSSHGVASCYHFIIIIPATFLAFVYLYAWMIWRASRRAERDEAEASRLSVSEPALGELNE